MSCAERVLFLFLCGLEKIYSLFFALSQKIRHLRGQKKIPGVTIISVGNLTTGGTGKSVVVSFLVDLLGADSCAIISRGYGRTIINNKKNIIVSDHGKLLVDVAQAGDEAFMLAKNCRCSVIVGSDRLASCKLLMQRFSGAPKYFILDDAYQNHKFKKNCEILLIDARASFDNGHCLPAGRLREKDYQRADIIMLTHADRVSSQAREQLKKVTLSDFPQDHIFFVKHVIKNLLRAGQEQEDKTFFAHKKILAFAGIGSFGSFLKSIEDFGLIIGGSLEFPDHYDYTLNDIERIISSLEKNGLNGAVTTAKDWYKLEPLLKKYYANKIQNFFVAPVSIEFLSPQEYSQFVEHLKSS